MKLCFHRGTFTVPTNSAGVEVVVVTAAVTKSRTIVVERNIVMRVSGLCVQAGRSINSVVQF